jgi:TolB protein
MKKENWSLAVLASSLLLSACNDRFLEPSADQPTGGEALGKGSKAARQGMIVFQSDRDGGNPEIYIMSGAGAGQTRITTSDASELMPAWSPDQTKIVFARFPFRGIESDLFIMNADGTGLRQLTAGPASDWYPDWSPDGSRIAFEREGAIVIVNADGTNETILPHSPDYYDSEPDWSPDGTRLTFSRDRIIDGVF